MTLASSTPDLSVLNVSKKFAGARVVDSISFDVAHGEYLCILGPSGCGKTTTLRIVAGLEYPDSGQVVVRGANITELPAHRRPVNTVFQHYALFPHLNVEANIGFGLRLKKKSRAEIANAVGRMLDLVSLKGYEQRWPHQINGGERQRVTLARALVNEPIVLLLDEPLGALDKRLRDQMQRELKAIQKRTGITFIHVTHDQEEAMTLADRIAVMESGRIIQLDTPRAVYDRPSNRFVAAFLGEMNFLPGTVKESAGSERRVDIPEVSTIGAAIDGVGRPGDAVTIGIRPEKIVVQSGVAQDEAGFNKIHGVIADISYLGVRTLITVALGNGVNSLTVAAANAEVGLTPGTQITVRWKTSDTIVFPADDRSMRKVS